LRTPMHLRAVMASSHEHDASPSGPDHSTAVSGPRTGAPTRPAPIFLTADETASLLRTSRKAVYAMAERAQLPGVTRIGRRLLVRRDDLLSWLDERRAASPGGTRR
jgi:excisionase family DNA binding protein